jgi:hypothetical protein
MTMAQQMITVRLPPAPPESYLRWMSFWRDVEAHMAENPALLDVASRESAPFAGDAVSEFLSTEVVRAIMAQAGAAHRDGQAEVAPVITGAADLLDRAIDYVERRGQWLATEGVPEAMGIEPLGEDLLGLRQDVLESVRRALPNQDE